METERDKSLQGVPLLKTPHKQALSETGESATEHRVVYKFQVVVIAYVLNLLL